MTLFDNRWQKTNRNTNNTTLGDAVLGTGVNIFNRTLGRLFGAGLRKGAESPLRTRADARWSMRNTQTDWRVKLQVPSANAELIQILFGDDQKQPKSAVGTNYKVMGRLSEDRGIVFPLTPTILIQHTASYNPMAQVHNNYPFYAYQNSETSEMTIIGQFPVQNQDDAQHWVATLHFLRTVTKMFFGGDDNFKGNPPPILRLNGYGQHVFKNVPVVVKSFTVELTDQVDYICTDQSIAMDKATIANNPELRTFSKDSMIPSTWAPTMSTFTVQVQPIYSRQSVKNFSLQEFASGKLNNVGGTKTQEGIGFI
jgi:hypothetical protein